MLKKYMVLSELLLFMVMLTGFVHASTQGQTRRQAWEQAVRADIASLFETILDTGGELRRKADSQGAVDMVIKYEQQLPVEEKLGEVVVKNPLREFLSAPYGNYPGGLSKERPLQGIFYERAREKRLVERQNNLDDIAIFFIDKTDPGFFTAPPTSTLNEKITGGENSPIPYLLFALRYNMPKVAKKLLDKAATLAQSTIAGRSAYSYAFEGGIVDPGLIKKLGDGGAQVQEADFDYFTDHAKKAEFLAWLIKHGVSLTNAQAKIAGLKKSAEGLAAQLLMNRFSGSLQVLAQEK